MLYDKVIVSMAGCQQLHTQYSQTYLTFHFILKIRNNPEGAAYSSELSLY